MTRAVLATVVLFGAGIAYARGGEQFFFHVDLRDASVSNVADAGPDQFWLVSLPERRNYTFTSAQGDALLYAGTSDGGRNPVPLRAPLGEPSGFTSWAAELPDGYAVAYRERRSDGGLSDTVHAFDGQLHPLWTRPPRPVRDGYADARVVAGKYLLLAHESDPAELVDARTGKTVQTFGPSKAIASFPLPVGDTLIEAGGVLRRLGPDLRTRWKIDLDGELLAIRVLSSQPYTVGTGKWAAAPLDGAGEWLVKTSRQLLLVNPADGKVRWRAESLSENLPSVAGDRVFDAAIRVKPRDVNVVLDVRDLKTGRLLRSIPVQHYRGIFDQSYVQVVRADADSVVVRVQFRVLD